MLNFLAFETSHKSCILFFVFGVPNAKILAFETPFARALRLILYKNLQSMTNTHQSFD